MRQYPCNVTLWLIKNISYLRCAMMFKSGVVCFVESNIHTHIRRAQKSNSHYFATLYLSCNSMSWQKLDVWYTNQVSFFSLVRSLFFNIIVEMDQHDQSCSSKWNKAPYPLSILPFNSLSWHLTRRNRESFFGRPIYDSLRGRLMK